MFIAALMGCSYFSEDGNFSEDLERLCAVATEIEKDTDLDLSRGLPELIKKSREGSGGLTIGPAGQGLLRAVDAAPPKLRRQIVHDVLAAQGLDDIRCKPLKGILIGPDERKANKARRTKEAEPSEERAVQPGGTGEGTAAEGSGAE